MKISRIKIQNFRSIEFTEFSVSDFNIVVGQNNCGKTNFFESIEYFFNGLGRGGNITDLKYRRDANREISVEIEFTGALEGASQMRNQANKTKIETVLNQNDTVVVVRSSELTKRKVLVNNTEVNTGTGFDAALNDFLPKFEYVNTRQYYESVAKYSKSTPIGIMLSGVLAAILEANEQYLQFQEKFKELFEDDDSAIKAEFESVGNKVKIHLEKQFPDCTKVKFEVTAPVFDDLLKNFDTTVDDGIETLAEEKGDGMQRALMLAIIQAYADFRKANDEAGKSFLFFIDEAELHLHPTAQRKLKNVLYTLSQSNDQVFINTHSSVFVADNEEGQIIFKAEKHNGQTQIEAVNDKQKPYIVFELLGGSPSDLLLPRNFLIVEGVSEYELLTRIIDRFYSDMPQIQIIKACGDIDQIERTINAIEKAFTPLDLSIYKERIVILMDQPSAQTLASVTEFLRKNRHLQVNNQHHQLMERNLEQCYPDITDKSHGNWKKTQIQLEELNENGKKVFNGPKKVQLAKHVGNNITQERFETDLSCCFNALNQCWNKAFN
jgi:predicted ATP-dependent endonuclease of OLD family